MTAIPEAQAETIQFTAQERERYRQPRLGRLVFDLSLPWLQALLGCAVFIYNPGIVTWLIAVFLIGGAQHGLSLVSHEAVHRLVWPSNKRVNDFVANYFFAAPALLPFNIYRQRHMLHHKLVSREGDTKSYYLRDLRGKRLWIEIARSLCGIDYLTQATGALKAGQAEGDYDDFEGNFSKDKRALLITHALIFLLFLTVDPLHFGIPTYYVLLWLGPMVTVSLLFGKLRSIVEHQPPPEYDAVTQDTEYFKNTPAPMLRSVQATWFERLFLSKINFHFHAEHHLWPWINYQHLPAVNRKLWEGHAPGTARHINNNLVVSDGGYLSVLLRLMRAK